MTQLVHSMLTIGGNVWFVKTRIIEGLLYDVILGNNLLQHAAILLPEKKLKFGDIELQLLKFEQRNLGNPPYPYLLVLSNGNHFGDEEIILKKTTR